MKKIFSQSFRLGFAPILIIGFVAILVFIAFITFGPIKVSNLGQLSVRQTEQESHAVVPDGAAWTFETRMRKGLPPCGFRANTNSPPYYYNYGYGDLNHDGKINSIDSLLLQRFVAGLSVNSPLKSDTGIFVEISDVSDSHLYTADSYGHNDGLSNKEGVNSTDALLIQRYAAQAIDRFPACTDRVGLYDFYTGNIIDKAWNGL